MQFLIKQTVELKCCIYTVTENNNNTLFVQSIVPVGN